MCQTFGRGPDGATGLNYRLFESDQPGRGEPFKKVPGNRGFFLLALDSVFGRMRYPSDELYIFHINSETNLRIGNREMNLFSLSAEGAQFMAVGPI